MKLFNYKNNKTKMQESEIILIKDDAVNIDELFVDQNWKISKLYNHIYMVLVQDKPINWLVKTYSKSKYAIREQTNLNQLKTVSGIPRVLCSGISDTFNYIMISKVPGIDLYEHIQKYGIMHEQEIKNIAKQLLTIINEVHKRNIIHRDIKPENIIYDKKTQTISLIDFEEKYTEDFQSPEQVIDRRITRKTDIWSIGVTLYFLGKGKIPFHNGRDILKKTIKYPTKWSGNFIDFLSVLIEKNVKLRYSATEALTHVWLL